MCSGCSVECNSSTWNLGDDAKVHDWPNQDSCQAVSDIFFLPRKNSCSYLERLQTPQKELFHSDVLLFVCLFVIVMSWHWKASNNSLWLWNVKNGSLTPSVICMTPLPSHKLSFSATQKERLVHSCIPKDLYAIFLLVCKPSYIYLWNSEEIIFFPYQVDWLVEKMREANFTVSAMHGDMPQKERDAIMKEFRSGQR